MARFNSNENFPLPVIPELRRLGHNVWTSLESGQANRSVSDVDVLAFASREGRALLTLNRKHFIRLHSLAPTHAGILVCTFNPDFLAKLL